MNNVPKHILAISGSTRADSSNAQLLRIMAALAGDRWNMTFYNQLDQLPHFNPDLNRGNVPEQVSVLRAAIEAADGVIICTPEYVFSLPGSLKNLLEWLVSTTLLTDKPTALVTASASGEKAHDALQLVVGTLQARFTPATTLLISGVRGKLAPDGHLTDVPTEMALAQLVDAFTVLLSR
ncbi:NADPH azoreductase [Fibrella aestuarina BUZ 2]|uniref:NADPH azoreductase n=1 Tax=Fibrella aestuarina BUZ 2 TaxID=1166018 RepID=I0K4C1_9BACT|nr:NADPH-dependent FMN reductase [Fibrella aestuarina]CCG98974.1 NADPH azoreductase [Fibrella aestuarina BUZ 2]